LTTFTKTFIESLIIVIKLLLCSHFLQILHLYTILTVILTGKLYKSTLIAVKL